MPLVIPADTLFDIGSSRVRHADVAKLHAFAARLARVLEMTAGSWTIVGATDSTGTTASNEGLGLTRAEAVLEVLGTVPGVDPDHFRANSWGEACPAVDETTALDLTQARAQNRRVVLLPPDVEPACPIP